MKRDLDLVREILLEIERRAVTEGYEIEVELEGRAANEVAYHMRLLVDAGLVDATASGSHDRDYDDFSVRGLTWDGHEFLDAARSSRVWGQVKTIFREKSIGMTFDLTKTALGKLAARALLEALEVVS